jgi:hypothetical protein
MISTKPAGLPGTTLTIAVQQRVNSRAVTKLRVAWRQHALSLAGAELTAVRNGRAKF